MSPTDIKPGVAITVTTWENDADNYRTDTLYGLTLEIASDLVDVLKLFTSYHNGGGIGNILYDFMGTDNKIGYQQVVHDACTPRLLEYINSVHGRDGESDVEAPYYWLCSKFSISNEYYATRVVDEIKLHLIAGELVITELGSY